VDSHEVDEVLQRSGIIAWKKFESLENPDAFRAWFCMIARFEALRFRRDAARAKTRMTETVLELLADEGLAEAEQTQRELDALQLCLAELPEPTRRLVLAAHQPGETVKRVASEVTSSLEAAYKRVHRARLQLLKCIELRLAAEGDS
jgi:RNA polymerase sigma-70 factor (ECF subfamily)